MKKQTDKNEPKTFTAIDLCRAIVVTAIVELFRKHYEIPEEENGEEGAMCGEAQIIDLCPKPQQLHPETDRERQIYEHGQADAYLKVIENAVNLTSERNSEEIMNMRHVLMDVMPDFYHDRIKHISSARKYKIEQIMKYNNCNIGQVVESGGNATMHVHMGEEKKANVKSFNMSEQQLSAIQRALDNGCISDNGDGTYRSNMEDSSLAYFCGRIFCGDYCVAEAGKLVWKKGTTNFPNAFLSPLFGKKDLGNSRSTRIGKAVPKDYQLIEEIVDEA